MTIDLFSPSPEPTSGAVFSDCGTYRYRLWRTWGDGERVAFCMLNPSTATEVENDPTIRRCIGFAKDLGFRGLVVVNLFALRSTDPAALLEHPEPIGPKNLKHIVETARECSRVVAAWGAHKAAEERGPSLANFLRGHHDVELACLGKTKSGAPRHPLYLRKDAVLREWP